MGAGRVCTTRSSSGSLLAASRLTDLDRREHRCDAGDVGASARNLGNHDPVRVNDLRPASPRCVRAVGEEDAGCLDRVLSDLKIHAHHVRHGDGGRNRSARPRPHWRRGGRRAGPSRRDHRCPRRPEPDGVTVDGHSLRADVDLAVAASSSRIGRFVVLAPGPDYNDTNVPQVRLLMRRPTLTRLHGAVRPVLSALTQVRPLSRHRAVVRALHDIRVTYAAMLRILLPDQRRRWPPARSTGSSPRSPFRCSSTSEAGTGHRTRPPVHVRTVRVGWPATAAGAAACRPRRRHPRPPPGGAR